MAKQNMTVDEKKIFDSIIQIFNKTLQNPGHFVMASDAVLQGIDNATLDDPSKMGWAEAVDKALDMDWKRLDVSVINQLFKTQLSAEIQNNLENYIADNDTRLSFS